MKSLASLLSLIVLFCIERGAQPAAAIPDCLAQPACKLLNDQARQQSGRSAGGTRCEATSSRTKSHPIRASCTASPASCTNGTERRSHSLLPSVPRHALHQANRPSAESPCAGFLTQCEATLPPPEPIKTPLDDDRFASPPRRSQARAAVQELVALDDRRWNRCGRHWSRAGRRTGIPRGRSTDVIQYRPFALSGRRGNHARHIPRRHAPLNQ